MALFVYKGLTAEMKKDRLEAYMSETYPPVARGIEDKYRVDPQLDDEATAEMKRANFKAWMDAAKVEYKKALEEMSKSVSFSRANKRYGGLRKPKGVEVVTFEAGKPVEIGPRHWLFEKLESLCAQPPDIAVWEKVTEKPAKATKADKEK